MKLSLILLALLTGCTVQLGPLATPASCNKSVDILFHGDPSFTSDERTKIVKASADWAIWSSGQVNLLVVFDYEAAKHSKSPRVARGWAMDPILLKVEAQKNEYVLAFQQDGPMMVYLPTDKIDPSDLELVTAHEFGHAAGLRWPDCIKDDVCVHSPEPTALMAAAFSHKGFGPADLQLCRASCLCP